MEFIKNKKGILIIVLVVIVLAIIGVFVFGSKGTDGTNNKSSKTKGWKLEKGIGLSGTANTSKEPEIGDKITFNTESFYIIKIEGETVSALAEKKVDQTKNLQTDLFTQSEFDEDKKTVYEGSTIQGYVNNYVSITLENKAKGRLMTLEEVEALNADSRSGKTDKCPEWINKIVGTDTNLSYWLETPSGKSTIWAVNGKYSELVSGCFAHYSGAMNIGVRPVVDVSISQIKK